MAHCILEAGEKYLKVSISYAGKKASTRVRFDLLPREKKDQ